MEQSSDLTTFSNTYIDEKNTNIQEEIKDDLDNYFEEFMSSKPIFKDKSILQSNFQPPRIQHRSEYLNELAKMLAPALRNEKPSNVFVYGKTGTGKTLCINHVLNKMRNVANSREIPLKILNINCKLKRVADTEYRMLLEILKMFGVERKDTGHSTNELYKDLYRALDSEKQTIILVLDEIDALIKKAGDDVLYNLTRLNPDLKSSEVCLVGITNDLTVMDSVDARVKSSLNEEELVFVPYNATQIQDILNDRAHLAFRENVLDSEVIPRCSAYMAREHGDVRRALELLKYAGEIAEREGSAYVVPLHIDKADKKSEKNRIIDIIKSQPKHYQLVLYSIVKTSMKEKHNLVTNKKSQVIEPTTTGSVFDFYNKLTKDLRIQSLTLRRISDIVVELDVLGIVNEKVVSKGRYGRTRYISIGLPKSMHKEVLEILKEDLCVG
ncbi:MAG: Cdc6/Cdc18 family protein [Candidatus Nanoarchaeia archaeon]